MHVLVDQTRDKVGIIGRVGGERAILGVTGDRIALNFDVGDVAGVHIGDEIGIGHLLLRRMRRRILEQVE
jgi:hypothetical protein